MHARIEMYLAGVKAESFRRAASQYRFIACCLENRIRTYKLLEGHGEQRHGRA